MDERGAQIGTITADYSRRDVTQRLTEAVVFDRLRDTAALVEANLRAVVATPIPDAFWARALRWLGFQ